MLGLCGKTKPAQLPPYLTWPKTWYEEIMCTRTNALATMLTHAGEPLKPWLY